MNGLQQRLIATRKNTLKSHSHSHGCTQRPHPSLHVSACSRSTNPTTLPSQLGRLTHYAFDAILVSAFLAGVKRSTGLTYALHGPRPSTRQSGTPGFEQ
jgi:Fungal protein of unknown function (DUF1748)